MYFSLEKLDLGVAPKGQPTKLLVQTDHRDAAAIDGDAPMSIVFAITRCFVAREIGEGDAKYQPFQVVYQLGGEAPAFFAFAVAVAGAALVREIPREVEAPPVRMLEVLDLIDEACTQIAAAAKATVTDLAAYERALDIGADDHAYYAAIVTLGAFAADTIRSRAPAATWQHAPGSVVPFALAPPGGDAAHQVPVFGLAQRYIDGVRAGATDITDAPSTLIGLMFGDITKLTI